jgi:hypothetical protein
MIRITGATLALLALAPALRADDPPKAATPAEQVKALQREFQDARIAFSKAYQAAKTDETRQKAIQEILPRPEKFNARFLEVAAKYPKDPAAVDALTWIVMNNGLAGGKEGPRNKALSQLAGEHLQSPNLVAVCTALARSFDPAAADFLHTVLDKSTDRAVQGAACLALGRSQDARIQMHERLKGNPQMARAYESMLGKQDAEALATLDPEKVSKEAEKYFERVVKEYSDVQGQDGKKLGDVAANQLVTLRNPVKVGQPAPEIEGEDIDGQKFKLSDYKGKVVLLDFWGHW